MEVIPCPGFRKDTHCPSRSLGGAGALRSASHPAGSTPGPSPKATIPWPLDEGSAHSLWPWKTRSPRPVVFGPQCCGHPDLGIPGWVLHAVGSIGFFTLDPVSALLAQWLGHLAHNEAIPGSNPGQSNRCVAQRESAGPTRRRLRVRLPPHLNAGGTERQGSPAGVDEVNAPLLDSPA